jgi:(p)ppGpp synthase/HD superfamily hydrolase
MSTAHILPPTDYSAIDKKVAKIIKKAQSYMKNTSPDFVEKEINKAYLYARDAHEGVFRHSGEPYIDHPVEATLILLDLNPDVNTIQACLLHDVVEDTPRTLEEIETEF